ncbi:WD repeat-containing protein mio [Smittium culicis]|uniref:WD repeat-containing protein mio n=1 Tax=Smittium culicis TaxID=133412 RepID=A0A1R1X1Y9_9FUNG|nr:WD repeat-containing protein mio [Smittium culicis]
MNSFYQKNKVKCSPIENDNRVLICSSNKIELLNINEGSQETNNENFFEKLDEIYFDSELSCFSWGKKSFCGYSVIAAGSRNGAVELCFIDEIKSNSKKYSSFRKGKPVVFSDFFLKEKIKIFSDSGRKANDISFNSVDHSRVVVGFDTNKSASSIQVFDVVQEMGVQEIVGGDKWVGDRLDLLITQKFKYFDVVNKSKTVISNSNLLDDLAFRYLKLNQGRERLKTVSDFVYEPFSIKSVAWLPRNPYCVVAGASNDKKSIRMYDTNCPGISQSVAFYENTTFENKDICAIHGIEFDPFNSFRFMANDRNKTIKFYDLRWPFSSLVLDVGNVVGSNIIESRYCKDKKGVISVLGTNRNNVSVWEIDQSREKPNFTKQNPRNFTPDGVQVSSTIDGYFDKEDYVGVKSFTFCDFSNQDNAMVESFSCYSNTFRVNPIPESNKKFKTDYSPIIISCLSNGKILSSKFPKAQFASISPLNDIPITNTIPQKVSTKNSSDSNIFSPRNGLSISKSNVII